MSSSATGVGMPICFLGAILLILTQKSSQKFGDVLGILHLVLRVTVKNGCCCRACLALADRGNEQTFIYCIGVDFSAYHRLMSL